MDLQKSNSSGMQSWRQLPEHNAFQYIQKRQKM